VHIHSQIGPTAIIVILVVAGIAAAASSIWNATRNRQRRQELFELAVRSGLDFNPGNNPLLPIEFGFIDKLNQGENRTAFNVIFGTLNGRDVVFFDYHYETHSTDGKGNRSTTHHYFSVAVMRLDADFPKLTIAHEGILSKIAQAFGYADINFESAEFSRAFCVRSPDKKFAYDVCNAQMIEYLLANRDVHMTIELHALALLADRQLPAAQIELNMQRLLEIRSRLPDYLFTKV
jgi:hypothetical protein